MKKIFSLCLSVFMISLLSLSAFADLASPAFESYKVCVDRYDGAVLTYSSGDTVTLPRGTVLEVNGEYQDGDSIILEVKYRFRSGTVNAADTIYKGEFIDESDLTKLDTPLTFTAINKNGSSVLRDASDSSTVVSVVPYGTEIKAEYTSDLYMPACYYVVWDNYGGWISPDNVNFALSSEVTTTREQTTAAGTTVSVTESEEETVPAKMDVTEATTAEVTETETTVTEAGTVTYAATIPEDNDNSGNTTQKVIVCGAVVLLICVIIGATVVHIRKKSK